MNTALLVLAIVIGLPGAVACAQVTVLTLASLAYRDPHADVVDPVRFLVFVAARNEEAVLDPTLRAIMDHKRPRDRVLVVADRCHDRTASIARRHGTLVLERPEGSEPGKAAALNAGLRFASDLEWDAVVFVDADSVVEPGFFDACEQVLGTGASVAQARSEAERRPGALGGASVAMSALGGVALARGRDVMHGWVRLKGSGMVLRRELAVTHVFQALGASEDAQLSLELCIRGYRHRHVDRARLRFAVAASMKDAATQELRYESGRLAMARRYVPRLMRARGFASKDAVVHLCTPPVSVSVLLLVLASACALLGGWYGVALVGVGLLAALALDVVIALREARVGREGWLALLLAPAYLLWKGWIQLRAIFGFRRAQQPFEPTPRG
jgi:1,2-diacylglycerol 3-beta-glucosyltransferase